MMNKQTRNLLMAALLVLAVVPAARATTADPLTLHLLQGSQTQVSLDDAPTRDIRVNIWTDAEENEVLRRGEAFTLNFETNTDLYVVIYRIDVDGRVEVLWPESRYNDGFVYGNHSYSIPSPADAGRLRVGNSKGVEYIEAIASAYPFDLRALGIDFRFDRDDYSRHEYYIDGDPFLAVNDINYAITGLEEDVDYVVTDWVHLYVEEQVEYARYSCNQCHLDDAGQPTVVAYVDTCPQVEVRVDWGWHRSWYVSFGWYPLYSEPPYYYWDYRWSRPYWYAWYPVPYRWPAYSCYTRPYPVWWWRDSGYWVGDYASHWSDRRTRSVPLYDVERVRSRTTTVAARDGTSRTVIDRPVSARGTRVDDGRRVDRDTLVRNSTPPRRVDRPGTSATRGRGNGTAEIVDPGRGTNRGTIRTDRGDRERVVSQRPADGGRRGSSVGDDATPPNRENGRRWTRPQVQNDRGSADRPSGRDGGVVRSPGGDARRTPAVDGSRSGSGSSRSGGNVDRSKSGSSSNRSGGNVDRSRSGRSGSGSVERPKPNGSGSRTSPPRQKVDRGSSRSSGKSGQVKPQRSAPPRQQPKPQPAPRSREGSGSSRKGGGGRKG